MVMVTRDTGWVICLDNWLNPIFGGMMDIWYPMVGDMMDTDVGYLRYWWYPLFGEIPGYDGHKHGRLVVTLSCKPPPSFGDLKNNRYLDVNGSRWWLWWSSSSVSVTNITCDSVRLVMDDNDDDDGDDNVDHNLSQCDRLRLVSCRGRLEYGTLPEQRLAACLRRKILIIMTITMIMTITTEMQKAADAADISVLFFFSWC